MSKGKMVKISKELIEKVYAILNGYVRDNLNPKEGGYITNVWLVKEEIRKVLRGEVSIEQYKKKLKELGEKQYLIQYPEGFPDIRLQSGTRVYSDYFGYGVVCEERKSITEMDVCIVKWDKTPPLNYNMGQNPCAVFINRIKAVQDEKEIED